MPASPSPKEQPAATWNKTVGYLAVGAALALLTFLLFRSAMGAAFVFVVVMLCRTWQDIRVLFYAGLAALLLRSFTYEPFHIPSGSMKSTLLIGDYIWISKFAYGYSRYSIPLGLPFFSGRIMEFHHPQRGDVVVFRPPGSPKVDFIKRVMGLPGDRIQVRGGEVYINGRELPRQPVDTFVDTDEAGHVETIPRYRETLPEGKVVTILQQQDTSGYADNTPVFVVPPGHYFMMGDNRDHSRDSRFSDPVGFVPEENIVGKAEIIFFTVNNDPPIWDLHEWVNGLHFDRSFDLIR